MKTTAVIFTEKVTVLYVKNLKCTTYGNPMRMYIVKRSDGSTIDMTNVANSYNMVNVKEGDIIELQYKRKNAKSWDFVAIDYKSIEKKEIDSYYIKQLSNIQNGDVAFKFENRSFNNSDSNWITLNNESKEALIEILQTKKLSN